MKYLKQCVLPMLLVLCCTSAALATTPELPQKDITFTCSVDPAPTLDSEFTVTVSFRINERTAFSDHPYSGGEAFISTFQRQEYVSGDTILTGKFMPGEIYELAATYRAVAAGRLSVAVYVRTRGEVDSAGQYGSFSDTRTVHRCGRYWLGETTPPDGKVFYDSTTGVTIRKLTGDDYPELTRVGGAVVEVPVQRDSASRIDQSDNETPTRIYLRRRNGGRYMPIHTIMLSGVELTRIVFADLSSDKALIPTFSHVDEAVGTLVREDDSTFVFTPTANEGKGVFVGAVNGVELVFEVELLSKPQRISE
jgi:hypothetical protein